MLAILTISSFIYSFLFSPVLSLQLDFKHCFFLKCMSLQHIKSTRIYSVQHWLNSNNFLIRQISKVDSMECEQKCHHLNKVLLFNHQTVYQTNSLLTPGKTPKTVKVICIKCFKECKTSQWFTARKCFLPGLDFKSSQMTLPCLFPLPLVTVIKTLSKSIAKYTVMVSETQLCLGTVRFHSFLK